MVKSLVTRLLSFFIFTAIWCVPVPPTASENGIQVTFLIDWDSGFGKNEEEGISIISEEELRVAAVLNLVFVLVRD